jgi:DNA-binding MurR/RpiR family transcriptional regulator
LESALAGKTSTVLAFQPTLTARIREHYSSLRPAERRIADLILNFPGEIAGYAATELAVMAKTSNAAVSRFVKRIGFQTYDEMRVLSRDIKMAGSPLFQMDHSADHEPSGIVARYVETTVAALQHTCSTLTDALIEELATAIVGARRLWIVGFRHSYFLAGYFHWELIHVRPDVLLLPATGTTLGETMADIGRGDMMIAFGMRRRPGVLRSLLATTRGAGARILVIADLGLAEDLGADWTVRCDTRQLGPVDNHASVLLLCHMLLDRVIVRSGASGRQRFGLIDELHVALEEL